MSLMRSSAAHMGFAFLAMGGWAVWANLGHPMPRPVVAGLVQGCMSALITLLLKRMIERLGAALPGLAALLVPPVAAVLISLALLTTMHRLAGTPEIARTIALPLTVTFVYASLYSHALWSHRHG